MSSCFNCHHYTIINAKPICVLDVSVPPNVGCYEWMEKSMLIRKTCYNCNYWDKNAGNICAHSHRYNVSPIEGCDDWEEYSREEHKVVYFPKVKSVAEKLKEKGFELGNMRERVAFKES